MLTLFLVVDSSLNWGWNYWRCPHFLNWQESIDKLLPWGTLEACKVHGWGKSSVAYDIFFQEAIDLLRADTGVDQTLQDQNIRQNGKQYLSYLHPFQQSRVPWSTWTSVALGTKFKVAPTWEADTSTTIGSGSFFWVKGRWVFVRSMTRVNQISN